MPDVPLNEVLRQEATDLAEQASKLWGVPIQRLLSGDKHRRTHEPRCAVAWVLNHRGWYLIDIATFLDRDHSTMWTAIRRCEQLMLSDADYRTLVHALADGRDETLMPDGELLRSMLEAAQRTEDLARVMAAAAHNLAAAARDGLALQERRRERTRELSPIEEAAG